MPESLAAPDSPSSATKQRPAWPVRFALIAWWLAIFTGTHLPIQPSDDEPPIPDKLAHYVAFAGLGFLLPMWRGWRAPVDRKTIATCSVILASYAIFDELTQIPVGRTAEWYDGVADLCGGLTGLLAATLIARRTPVE